MIPLAQGGLSILGLAMGHVLVIGRIALAYHSPSCGLLAEIHHTDRLRSSASRATRPDPARSQTSGLRNRAAASASLSCCRRVPCALCSQNLTLGACEQGAMPQLMVSLWGPAIHTGWRTGFARAGAAPAAAQLGARGSSRFQSPSSASMTKDMNPKSSSDRRRRSSEECAQSKGDVAKSGRSRNQPRPHGGFLLASLALGSDHSGARPPSSALGLRRRPTGSHHTMLEIRRTRFRGR